LPNLDAGIARLRGLPAPLLVASAISAGVVEEVLYRG